MLPPRVLLLLLLLLLQQRRLERQQVCLQPLLPPGLAVQARRWRGEAATA